MYSLRYITCHILWLPSKDDPLTLTSRGQSVIFVIWSGFDLLRSSLFHLTLTSRGSRYLTWLWPLGVVIWPDFDLLRSLLLILTSWDHCYFTWPCPLEIIVIWLDWPLVVIFIWLWTLEVIAMWPEWIIVHEDLHCWRNPTTTKGTRRQSKWPLISD